MDFKDISTVPATESQEGKRQHIVEVRNFVDAGTSVLLHAQAREDFHAQTAMQTVISFLREHGRPPMMTFDRDISCSGLLLLFPDVASMRRLGWGDDDAKSYKRCEE
ncbi:hypothetical protein KSD_80400 [Ktedonobacter sp. SOSP1-85]|uniref:hypothetical protein n=1 Tax=Ktedonobacter sp. SOSP1-85 TaxID=2778367 RepID=UPI001A271B59|nr:hypothetical protein [Ktedonobacter sp. SOSP1-85]GHO80269.1 hypothetical protein KSD_80400 [Ktedonobacter sp. SOSP1-85]